MQQAKILLILKLGTKKAELFIMSLYRNMNRRKKAGTSRSKSKSTIASKTYAKMKSKKGGFAPKRKRK